MSPAGPASHVKGINWEIINELLIAEIKRQRSALEATSNPPEQAAAQWMLDELGRMNEIAASAAMAQE